MKTVGILGGMGPAATIALQQLVLQGVDAADDSDHVPLLIDSNTQVPSRIQRLIEGDGEDPEPVLIAMAQRLEQAGAAALAMPCNTAHHYAPAVRNAVDIPLLDMIALAVDAACQHSSANDAIGLLGSPATSTLLLYDTPLAARDRVTLWPDNPDNVLDAIKHIKANGPSDHSEATLRAASAQLAARGAKVQIIACTEFSLFDNDSSRDVQSIDALKGLANAIIEFAS